MVNALGPLRSAACVGLYVASKWEPEALAHVCREIRRVIYLGAVEQGARSSGIGDNEAVFGEGAQDSTGIVEEFEGLVAGVNNGRGDFQVFQTIDFDVRDRGLDGQAGSSTGDDGRSDEGNDSSTEG